MGTFRFVSTKQNGEQVVLAVLEKNKNMKIIVPMAGRGSRLRPHTLTIPKPLIPVAGVPIVEKLVRDIAGVVNQPIEEVSFHYRRPSFLWSRNS